MGLKSIQVTVICDGCDYSYEGNTIVGWAFFGNNRQLCQMCRENPEKVAQIEEETMRSYNRIIPPDQIAARYLKDNDEYILHEGHMYVQITKENVGFALAACPGQVCKVFVNDDDLSIRSSQMFDWSRFPTGTWLRVEADHLTPATPEQVAQIEEQTC